MRPILLVAAGLTFLLGTIVSGQEPIGRPGPAEGTPSQGDRMAEQRPAVYYLRGADGELVPVVGFDIEDFEELYQLKEGLADAHAPPRYHIQTVRVDGAVEENVVRLDVSLRVVTHAEGWIRFPIRLGGAVLTESPTAEAETRFFVRWSESDSSYLGEVLGKPDRAFEFRVRGLVKLEHAGEATSFTLDLPHAAQSQCVLVVPGVDITASASGSGVVEQANSSDKTTKITLSGYRGPTVISWSKRGLPAAHRPPVLECSGQIVSRLDANAAVTNAELTIQSLGMPFDRFRVRLPGSSEFLEADCPDQTITCEPVAVDSEEDPILEIHLERETVGPIKVRLSAKQTRSDDAKGGDAKGANSKGANSKGAAWFELSGFDVLDAVRQSGRIAVETAGNRYLIRGPSHGVHQIDEIPKAIAREDVVAAFEYFSRPCSLTARVTTRSTRIGVEPEYRLFVEADRVRLEAALRYTIRGTKAHSLEVLLPGGWVFDSVGPESTVAVDGIEIGDDGLISMPLSEPTEGRLEIALTAHLAIPGDSNEIVVPLPGPKANSPAPAAVVIIPADNVEVTPNAQKTTGLVLQQSAPPLPLPGRQKTVFFYRTESGPQAFCAGFRVHGREIKLDVNTSLHHTPRECRVRQWLLFDVEYEPLDRVTFRVPKSILRGGRPRFFLEEKEVKVVPVEPIAPEAADAGFRLVLPEPRLGEFEVETRYRLPDELAPESSVERTVPLISSPGAIVRSNRLQVSSTHDIRAAAHDTDWTEGSAEAPAASSEIRVYEALGPRSDVVVRLTREKSGLSGATVVDRAWIQTRLTHAVRQDRACLRFTTRQSEVELLLPGGVATEALRLELDGSDAVWRLSGPNRVVLSIPPEPTTDEMSQDFGDTSRPVNRCRLLEVEYRFERPRSRRGPMRFEFPRLGGGAWIRRAYWQLILPRDEDVVLMPGSWVHEYRWKWFGLFQGRAPIMEQGELENWVGAPAVDAPPDGTNRYLFSTVGTATPCELVTSARALTVLIASGAVLIVGLCFIYVPRTRHAAVFLILAVAGAAAAMIHPEGALLGLQAASVGFALVLTALLLRRLFGGRRGSIVLEPSSSVLGSDSTKTQFPGSVAGGGDSAPPAVQPSSSARGSAL